MAMSMLRRMTPRKRVRSKGVPTDGGGLPFTLPEVVPGSRFAAARGGSAPTLVLDIDDTIMTRRGRMDTVRLYSPCPTTNTGVLCPYADVAINDLSSQYRIVRACACCVCVARVDRTVAHDLVLIVACMIGCVHQVALTARFQSCMKNTHRWLAANGLDEMPVMFATQMHPYDHSRIAFKAAAIQYLQDEGWEPVAGVGDRPSDLLAYSRCDLHTLAVCHTVMPTAFAGGVDSDDVGSDGDSDSGSDSDGSGIGTRRHQGDPFADLRRACRAEHVDPASVSFFQASPGLSVWRQVADALMRTPAL